MDDRKLYTKKHWYLCYIHACYNDLERSYFSKDLKFILNIDFYLHLKYKSILYIRYTIQHLKIVQLIVYRTTKTVACSSNR